ncbi:hypothetical protein [Actinotalea sp. K2]|uniref:hypothetical protein n=1 Tax=Actinotalea sp. K2 TaxID=2939438 RepID=UPI002017E25C|nr:hypothetical protein [Actinotalea sp. K2]MCL3860354.1 hypothetical protein [Actinotalea sp. K2]
MLAGVAALAAAGVLHWAGHRPLVTTLSALGAAAVVLVASWVATTGARAHPRTPSDGPPRPRPGPSDPVQ